MRRVSANILLGFLAVAYMTTFIVLTEILHGGVCYPGPVALGSSSGQPKEIPKKVLIPRRHIPLVKTLTLTVDGENAFVPLEGLRRSFSGTTRCFAFSLHHFFLYSSLGDRSPPCA